jgi:uncharacterized membrane protein (DUF4010 family)
VQNAFTLGSTDLGALTPIFRLALALALGLLVGLERGWHTRLEKEGSRVAGFRTFGIIGLLGGLWAELSTLLGPILLGFGFVGFAIVIVAAGVSARRETGDVGATTIIAALATFGFGALAATDAMELAVAGTVLMTLLLGTKSTLHHWVEKIEEKELTAGLKLLVMTLVLLPVLPDKGYGPFEALNPFKLWLMVVLISAFSFVGYVAMRLMSERRGLIVAAAAGGLVSSTAVTVAHSRMAAESPKDARLFAGTIVTATAIMYMRIPIVAAVVMPAVGLHVLVPMGCGAIASFAIAAALLHGAKTSGGETALDITNPLEFSIALRFGIFLAVVALAARAVNHWFGDSGIYALAGLSGLSDVDPITLSLAQMTGGSVTLATAVTGISIACFANMAVKTTISVVTGGRALARYTIPAMAGTVVAAGAGLAAALILVIK